jgi:DNA invertase Pin-like site-specific DNA recombinase
MIIGYARVSTTEQNLGLRRDGLKRAGCEKIIEDTVSGGMVQLPGMERVHDALRSPDVLCSHDAYLVAYQKVGFGL